MIIFGWGHQKIKNYGPVFKHRCNHCNNEDIWQLVGISTWFTLFFIPIFPYESKHMLICPVCNYGAKVESSEVEKLKQLAQSNSDLISGKITTEEYRQRLQSSTSEKGVIDVSSSNSNTAVSDKNNDKIFCKHCGYKNVSQANFCKNCGKKINN